MSLSIKDIASKAKVSVTTVSRVINNSPAVKNNTREHVLKLIREFDYHPNMNARSLVRGTTHLLTLVTPPDPDFFGMHYFREIVRGISDALSQNHYRLMIYEPEDLDYSDMAQLNGLHTDGLFLLAPPLDDRLLKYLEVRKKPAVIISGRSDSLDWVDLNNLDASTQVMERLISLGHRRIGLVAGAVKDDRNSLDRLEGYISVLGKHGIPFDRSLVIKGFHKIQGGHDAAKKMLSRSDRPTALMCMNDYMAIGAIRAATELGLSVPGDVSVVGFDDVDMAPLMSPSISTMRQPFFEMGKIGCEMLVSRIAASHSPQKTAQLSGELVLRQSVREISAEKAA